jgi:hypothetical protein
MKFEFTELDPIKNLFTILKLNKRISYLKDAVLIASSRLDWIESDRLIRRIDTLEYRLNAQTR